MKVVVEILDEQIQAILREIEIYLQQQIKTRIIQISKEKKILEQICKVQKTFD